MSFSNNAFTFINPVPKKQTSLMPTNLGISALSRKIPINNRYRKNTVIDKKIDKIQTDKDTLMNLLKEKENEEILTLQQIEMDRRKREESKLNQIQQEIEFLKTKLEEKKKLESQIKDLYENQKKSNLENTLNYLETRKKKLSDDLINQENELNKVREDELVLKKKEEEKAIIRDFEKKKQQIELEKKRQEHEEILKKQQEKKETEINNIRLKYLKQNVEKIKEDLIFKEKQEQLLHEKKQQMLRQSSNMNKGDILQLREDIMSLNSKKDGLQNINKVNNSDKKIPKPDTFLNMEFQNATNDNEEDLNILPNFIKKPDTNLNSDPINVTPTLGLNDILESIKKNLKNTDGSETKLQLLEELVKDIYKDPSIEERKKKEEEKKKQEKMINKQNTMTKVQQLPNLMTSQTNTPILNILDKDEDNDFSEILDKINEVNSALSQ